MPWSRWGDQTLTYNLTRLRSLGALRPQMA